MVVSLVCTVRNEADNIAYLLDSMLAQTRLPDEIVINDCQSNDATVAIVRSYCEREPRIRLVAGGHNISSGRNYAIAAARGDVIATTDAGLVLDRAWLQHLVAPIEANEADHVGGFYYPQPRSLFELTLGATNYRTANEIVPETFLPFGKSMAFRRQVWQQVGGFPEWASHCEDILFDMAITDAGFRRVFVPKALVYFRPRSNLRDFARQYYYYARGDGRADLFRTRHIIRYATYVSSMVLVLHAWRTPAWRWFYFGLLAAGVAAYTKAPYRRLLPRISSLVVHEQAYAITLVPIIRVVGDVAKMVGYPVGMRQRLSRSEQVHHSILSK